MKLNLRNRGGENVAIISLFLSLLLLVGAPDYSSAKPPKNDGGGVAIGVALLVCGGVVVYCMVRTCKKVFGTNTNSFGPISWPVGNYWTNQSPPCIEIVTCPCPCEVSALPSNFGFVHELQRTTNLIDWETVATEYGDVDEITFYDYDNPPEGASYRLQSW